jgi:hypothetical protein
MTINYRGDVDPTLLNHGFRIDVETLLGNSKYNWLVTSGFRDRMEQQRLWEIYKAGGPRAAPPGRSAHEWGLAVDVVLDGDPVKFGVQADYDTNHPGWQWLFEAVWKHNSLHNGRSFGDADHIERLNWKLLVPRGV